MHAQTTHMQAAPTPLIDRALKYLSLALVVAIVGFTAFYLTDRNLTPATSVVDQAVQVGEQAVRNDPGNAGLRISLADVYLSKGRLGEAKAQYRAALQIDETALLAHRGLGLVAMQEKQYSTAEAEFQTIVSALDGQEFSNVNRALEEVYYYLARAQIAQQELDAAVTSLQAALSIDRADADAWELLGSTYLAAGRPDEAAKALERATQFVPDSASPYPMLADAYRAAGNETGARYATAMNALYGKKAVDEAVTQLQGLTQEHPESTQGWVGLGFALQVKGQKTEAATAFQQALTLDPANFLARAGLAQVGGTPRS